MKYLSGLGGRSIFWAARVLWDPGQGTQRAQGCRDTGPVRAWCCPFVPQSRQPTLTAMICKTIPHNKPSNFLCKNPQVLQDWQNRGRKHPLLSLPPPTHPFQLLPFPFSAQLVLSPPGCRSVRAGGEYVWSDRKFLFCRQELTEGLWLKKVFYILYW